MEAVMRDGGVVTHLVALDARMGGLESRVGSLETKVGALDAKVGALDAKVGALEMRMGSIETKWDAVIPTLATREELQTLRGEMKEGFGLLRTEIHQGYASMARRLIGTLISTGALAVAAIAIVLAPQLSKAQRHVAPAAGPLAGILGGSRLS